MDYSVIVSQHIIIDINTIYATFSSLHSCALLELLDEGGNMASNTNMHPVERQVSTIAGGAFLLRGLIRSSLTDAALAAALLYRGVTGHSYLYQMLGVSTAGQIGQSHGANDLPEVERSITIGKSADELYRFWRDPQNLSQIMGSFADVTPAGDNRMHWRLNGPLVQNMEWDTQIVEDRPGELLSMKAVDGSQLPNEATIRFSPAPADWGTVATLHFRFDPPGGALGNSLAKMLGAVPSVLAEKALRRFKSLIETGEMPTLEHNPSARGSGDLV